ncbi:hypothetical protein LR48_Vigan01g099100 [Vigna angularis]|uniref:Uncharacterized protein n=1 Tax=Phaseolus angularis TaxID=3914 RepID=A0A0L9TLT1_PHAAN|nr:hypothetical protein LR48_Vigan01g099100 [Vigna angularis]
MAQHEVATRIGNLFHNLRNKMVEEAKRKGVTNVVPNLTSLVVDTHRPQSIAKKGIPTKVLGVSKDKKRLRVEYSLCTNSSRSKATDLNGLDSHTLIMRKGVQVTLTNVEKKVVKEVVSSTLICAFLELYSRTLVYGHRISSLLRKKLADKGKAKATDKLVNLKKRYEADQKL